MVRDKRYVLKEKMETHQLWNVNFLNQILDTMAEGLFTLDEQGVITSWNRSMEKISGYSAQEAVGHPDSMQPVLWQKVPCGCKCLRRDSARQDRGQRMFHPPQGRS